MMPSYRENPPKKKKKVPWWAFAIMILLGLALIILICLCVAYGVMSAKNQKNAERTEDWKRFEKKLDEIGRFAAQKAEKMKEENNGEKEAILKEFKMTPEKELRLQEIARMFRESMDTGVNPCEDFYKFACGNYRKGKEGSYARFFEVRETLYDRIWKALLSVNVEKVDKRLRKVYSYLQKVVIECKDPFKEEEIELTADIAKILEEIGYTPILKPKSSKMNPFTSALKLLKLTGVKTLLGIKRDRDTFNPQLMALYVDFPLDFLASQARLEATNVYNSLVLEKGNITEESIKKYEEEYGKFDSDAEEVFKVIFPTVEELAIGRATGEDDVSIDFEEAQSVAPNVVAALLTQSSAKELQETRIFWKIASQETALDLNGEGLGKFDDLISKYWWTFQSRIVEEFLRGLIESLESKGRFCMKSAQPGLNYAVLHLMVNTYDYGAEKLVVLRETIESIRTIFTAALFETDWLDPITTNKALNKLNRVTPRMFAPPLVYDNAAIQEYFQDLPELKGNETLMETLEAVNTMYVDKQFQELGSPSKTLFESFMVAKAFEINAFYSLAENSINVLVGYIQPPYLDWNDPKFYLYAVTGATIGHEFTHGFDTSGSKVDLNGKYKQWMSNESLANFQEKAKCFYEQYSQFCYPDKNGTSKCLDGELTSGETMADDGGLRFAYMAFKLETFLAAALGASFVNQAKLMPGFEDYTLDQLFFLSFANKMCWANEPQDFKDPHPPHSARVVGTLRNLPFFSIAFNCPAGSGMNPEKKCQVW